MDDPLLNYKRLRRILMKASEGAFRKDIHLDYTIERAIKEASSKHHYLPRYFIDGFLAADGLLDIYDKQRDVIIRDRKGSKGVFFENNRNSVDFGFAKPISLYEDAYSVLDNLLPAAIKLLRADGVDMSNQIFIELMANINVFILDLFWRNINTDKLFDEMYDKGKMTIIVSSSKMLSNKETDDLKQMPGFKQLTRLQIFQAAMQEALNQDPDGIVNGNLIHFPLAQICIGDMPFLFSTIPRTHATLLQLPVIVPISKSKLYFRNVERTKPYDYIDTCMFNALVIEQSSKYVCSANRTTLEAAIDFYRFAKTNDCLKYYSDKLFYNSKN